MGRSLQHFLLTRFNVRFPRHRAPDKCWLMHRLALFETFCFPSVRDQEDNDFTWVIFVDHETPSWVLSRLARLQNVRHFVPIKVKRYDRRRVATDLKFLRDHRPLLTSRLDNDDVIACDFVKTAKAIAGTKVTKWINYEIGYRFDFRGLYQINHLSNSFLNLYESRPVVKTALGVMHQRAGAYAPITNVSAKPMWIQVVHDKNLKYQRDASPLYASFRSIPDLLKRFSPEVVNRIQEIIASKGSLGIS